jgi:AraC-like DNA-binding protein
VSHTLVRAACLANFTDVAQAAGVNPVRLLLDAEIDPSVLQEPDLLLPTSRVRQLLEAAAVRSGIDSFGLRMAQSRQFSNFGPVGMLVRDQPTLRESIKTLIRYQAQMNGALAIMMEEQGDLVILREELIAQRGEPIRQSIELAVGVLFVTVCKILGSNWRPQRVCFSHSRPKKSAEYTQFFGSPVEFDHDFNGIVCQAIDLDGANSKADPLMTRYAYRLLDVLPDASIAAETTDIDNVRRSILLLLPSGRCTITQVSSHLGLVSRTVQRKLSLKGLNFSGLVNEVRIELVQRYIMQGNRPFTEIAMLLGFSALSGFSRWYQTQFNCSPSQARVMVGSTARFRSGSIIPGQEGDH